ncbi:hypothetical protein H6G41_04350 [Tolypothrix sp. FACHB-123]|uniref:hypothetical protein n=1 Tax=Tolypothrix sp. FACHB-123 TaxID=2692868 RepID=UPI001689E085|nr:hypothetical protein [Tolypothrix sp. FACHB-123]MBD2353859.1 hypothetical protein [Tolypothrix sp. FACHB-123]
MIAFLKTTKRRSHSLKLPKSDRIILELTKDHLELATELLEKLDEHWKLAPRKASL